MKGGKLSVEFDGANKKPKWTFYPINWLLKGTKEELKTEPLFVSLPRIHERSKGDSCSPICWFKWIYIEKLDNGDIVIGTPNDIQDYIEGFADAWRCRCVDGILHMVLYQKEGKETNDEGTDH